MFKPQEDYQTACGFGESESHNHDQQAPGMLLIPWGPVKSPIVTVFRLNLPMADYHTALTVAMGESESHHHDQHALGRLLTPKGTVNSPTVTLSLFHLAPAKITETLGLCGHYKLL